MASTEKNYDAIIGLGAALRGLNEFDAAEREFKRAMELDRKRGEAYYNLGVLYKDFRASKNTDLAAAIGTYKQAKDYFQQFMSLQGEQTDKTEAKEQIALIDRTVAQAQNFLKSQANQPPPPAAPPSPAPDKPAEPAPAKNN